MKRIWNSIGKPTKDARFQDKVLNHVEKSDGLKPFPAPKYASEKKHFEAAQRDEGLRQEVQKKNEKLLDNMNKMTIRSTNPPERWTSTKELPTRESEWEHRNDPVWEYGFYEPPLEKMPKGKLMFREAIEILRKMQEADTEGTSEAAVQMREKAKEALEGHVAVERVGMEKVGEMYEYFRPFERRDTQKVVSKYELSRLQDALQGRGDEMTLVDGAHGEVKRMIEETKRKDQRMARLNDTQQEQFEEAVKTLRAEEHERLQKRLGEINEMEKEFSDSVNDSQQKKKEAEEKK